MAHRAQRILVADGDGNAVRLIAAQLKDAGYVVDVAFDGLNAVELFQLKFPSLVITDFELPGLPKAELLKSIREISSSTPVIVISSLETHAAAIAAMRAGANEFFSKSLGMEQLISSIKKFLSYVGADGKTPDFNFEALNKARPIIRQSKSMREVVSVADRVASQNVSVLITGEIGCGKETIARRIHAKSSRADRAFIPINCASIPPKLLDRYMFGTAENVVITGNSGWLERFGEARGGTVYLAEVGCLHEALQGKLLSVLQKRGVAKLSEEGLFGSDVRIISASSKILERSIRNNLFRNDLYCRLAVIRISIPPLRDRVEDIPELTSEFIKKHAHGRELIIPEELIETLTSYSWPGNVRELDNICQRLVVLCKGAKLAWCDLPRQMLRGAASSQSNDGTAWILERIKLPEKGFSLVELEKTIILQVLKAKKWNVSKSASYLQLPRHVLAYRMEKYGIEEDRGKVA